MIVRERHVTVNWKREHWFVLRGELAFEVAKDIWPYTLRNAWKRERINEWMNEWIKKNVYSYTALHIGRPFISLPPPHTFLYSLTRGEISVMAPPNGPNANSTATGLWVLTEIWRKLANGGHSAYVHILGLNLKPCF